MGKSKGKIEYYAKRLGLRVETQTPGDGVRRYHFYTTTGVNWNIVATMFGYKAADCFLLGVDLGQKMYGKDGFDSNLEGVKREKCLNLKSLQSI